MSIMITIEGGPLLPPDEDGYQLPEWPWLNLCNSNARDVLGMVGILPDEDGDLAGVLEVDELPDVIRRCIIAINSPSAREPYVCPTTASVGAKGARLIDIGKDHEYLIDRTRRLLELLKKAQEERARVVWA